MAIQTRNRHQVRLPRLSIRKTQEITARIGTSGTAGVRKALGRSGWVRRSTITPIDTSTKANRVPMLTMSARVDRGTKVAMRATTTPAISEITQGVPYRGWTLDSQPGSSRSRLMANRTRLWPSIRMRMTVVSPASAPSDTRLAIQSYPTALRASAMGAAVLSSVYLTIPVRTIDTTTYRTVQMASDPRMPIGMSRWGLRVSSAVVATTSKPMKAKNTIAAPKAMPSQPKASGSSPKRTSNSGRPASTALAALGASAGGGMNGLQLAVLILTAPAAMNRNTTASLMDTMTALKRGLSFTPRIIPPVSSSTIAPAVRLTVPSPEIDSGIGNTEAKYWAQPTATAAEPRANSRTRPHPVIQAISSPREE